MRKITIILFMLVCSCSFCFTDGFAAERTPLFELCTSTTCPPCVSANYTLDNLMESYGNDLAIIRYHAWWPTPGNDPFYADNVTENRARIQYYDVNAVPDAFLDGADLFSAGSWNAAITSQLNVESPLIIELRSTVTGQVTVSITAEEDVIGGDARVHFVVTESSIDYTGTNGDPRHHQVMRDMIPDAAGIPLEIHSGETVEISVDYTIDPDWDPDNIEIVVFVQDHGTREVYQSAKMSRNISITNYSVNELSGDGDGYLDPGETAQLALTIGNFIYQPGFTSVVVELSTDDPSIDLTMPVGFFPDLSYGETVTNTESPFYLDIEADAEPHYASIHAVIYATDFLGETDFDLMIGEMNAVEEEEISENATALFQNFPNPFNPSTEIAYRLIKNENAMLRIFDINGRLVKTLVESQQQSAGMHSAVWDGTNDRSQPVGSGVYIYQLETERYQESRRMALLK